MWLYFVFGIVVGIIGWEIFGILVLYKVAQWLRSRKDRQEPSEGTGSDRKEDAAEDPVSIVPPSARSRATYRQRNAASAERLADLVEPGVIPSPDQ